MTGSSAQAAAPSPSTVRKVALAAMAGSAIEWYDFFIYLTAAALVFGPLFFPGASEVAAVLASFSTAAVGFVARQVGVPVGLVLGNSVFLMLTAIMGEAAFVAWGWRIPFLLSVVLIGVALYIQLRLEDTPVFRQLEERQQEGEETESRSPVLEVLRYHPKQVLLAGRVLRRQRRL